MAKTAKKAAAETKVEKVAVNQVELPQSATQQPVEQADDAAQLTIADLQGIAQIIDAACRRGAFGASEAGNVGVIYDKLANFLQIIAKQKAAEEAAKAGQ